MSDAIADLGYCAAACELEAHLCPWERAELEQRAAAYRREQFRLLGALPAPAFSKPRRAGAPRKRRRGVSCRLGKTPTREARNRSAILGNS